MLLHLTPLAAVGGCEVNCLRVIQGHGDCAHLVLVFGERGPMSAAWEEAGAQVEHLAAWPGPAHRFMAALADWRQTRETPDAVIYWSTSRLPIVLRVLRGWNTPWAVYLGNPLRPDVVSVARRWLYERVHATPATITLVACSHHVATSHRQAAYFRRFSTEVIYNAVDPALDQPHRHQPLSAGSAPRVGMVARLDPIKDHLTVIRALAATASVRPDIVVEFAGDGPLRSKLQEEARRLGVGDRVRFLGFKPVAPLLAEWDVYLHSTTEAEGMGTAVAEAMMAGLPCLVSDLNVMREVCGSEGAAYAPAGDPVGFGESLVRLVEDRERRVKLGAAAQDRARRMFGLPQVAAAYSRVIFSGLVRV